LAQGKEEDRAYFEQVGVICVDTLWLWHIIRT